MMETRNEKMKASLIVVPNSKNTLKAVLRKVGV